MPLAPAGYGLVGGQLKSDNVVASDLKLADSGGVPADADAVVIAGPTVPSRPARRRPSTPTSPPMARCSWLLDPFSPLGLDDVLKKYGVSFDNDLVLYRVMTSTGSQGHLPAGPDLSKWLRPASHYLQVPHRGYYLQMINARSIHIAADDSPSPKVLPLLTTGPEAWGWGR